MVRIFTILSCCLLCSMTACFRVGQSDHYDGPQERPASLETYFAVDTTYHSIREEIVEQKADYTLKHITLGTGRGPIVLDFYQTPKKGKELVMVFPVLGGKNIIEKHLASFFAESGFDAVIVNRRNEFKNPENFELLEEILRRNVVLDRVMLDFFEREYQKSKFGSFGISRGGINVAITAGVDPRLQYNVIVLGGTDVVEIFKRSNQRRIKKYVQSVMKERGLTEEEFFEQLKAMIKTDPIHTAHFIDSRNTLMILSIFDKTVPFEHGLELRQQMGYPDTIFLLADHYTGLLFTQTVSLVPPRIGSGVFPPPYIEHEAVNFFRRSFEDENDWKVIPYRVVAFPLTVLAEMVSGVVSAVSGLFVDEEEWETAEVQEKFWTDAAADRDAAAAATLLVQDADLVGK